MANCGCWLRRADGLRLRLPVPALRTQGTWSVCEARTSHVCPDRRACAGHTSPVPSDGAPTSQLRRVATGAASPWGGVWSWSPRWAPGHAEALQGQGRARGCPCGPDAGRMLTRASEPCAGSAGSTAARATHRAHQRLSADLSPQSRSPQDPLVDRHRDPKSVPEGPRSPQGRL